MPFYAIQLDVVKYGKPFEARNENDAYRIARQYILDHVMASKPETLVTDVTERLEDAGRCEGSI